MDARNLLSIAGVLLSLGGIGYYWGLGRPELTLAPTAGERRPDYEVRGIRFTESGKDGRLQRRLDSPGLRHYTTPQDEAELDRPLMRLYDNGREVWRLQAEQGISLLDGKEVQLLGGVIAERVDPAAVPVRFVTPALTAWPAEERLQSTSGIRLTSPHGELAGQVLQASPPTCTIDIQQTVTGSCAPMRR